MLPLIKSIIRTVRSVRPVLTWIFAVCVVLIFCIEFWWKNRPAMLGWKDATSGADLATNFLLSYIASYIFFLVGDQWEEVRDKQFIQPRINTRLTSIVMSYINAMTIIVDVKARTSFSQVTLRDITRKDWEKLKNEVLWLKEPFEGTVVSCFNMMNNYWIQFAEETRQEGGEIVSLFGDFDPKLTGIVDMIHSHRRSLLSLENSIEEGMRHSASTLDPNKPLPRLPPMISGQCYFILSAIDHGMHLVDYCSHIDNPSLRIFSGIADDLLSWKGKYDPLAKVTVKK
ncbi:MAG: hypothetical protein IPH53_06245 [Flavobacteriales bacterium]|nr:hypothetical protein [Flavobacteriales bacterium]